MQLDTLQQHINLLATLGRSEAPFLTCYLNVGAGDCHTIFRERAAVLRRTLSAPEARQAFDSAAARAEAFLAYEVRPGTKGLALFARGGTQPFFLPLQFSVPVPNWVAVSPLPSIYHLAEFKDSHHRYAVMLADGKSIRILGVNLGEVTQEIWDRRLEARRPFGRERAKERYEDQVRERASHFLREGIAVLDKLMLTGGYRHLFLAGNPRLTSQIRQALPRRLGAMVVGSVRVSPNETASRVVRATLNSFLEQEERESAALADRLQEAICTNGRAVAGTSASLNALRARQAEALILAKAYSPGLGWLCAACEATGAEDELPDRCPKCQAAEVLALDVKEELVRIAERTGCSIEIVNHSDALMRLGGVGCLLRYLAPQQYHRRAA